MAHQSKQDQVITLVTQKIESGEWLEGDKIPSQSEFRQVYGFKYGPLRSALLILKAVGFLEGRPGDGVYVAKSKISMTLEQFEKKSAGKEKR